MFAPCIVAPDRLSLLSKENYKVLIHQIVYGSQEIRLDRLLDLLGRISLNVPLYEPRCLVDFILTECYDIDVYVKDRVITLSYIVW